jgi:hypothetical protein
MKKNIIYIGFFVIASLGTSAQETKETIQPLSPKAAKGYIYNSSKDANGNSIITYKIAGSKKSNEIFFEEYTFDKDLKFTGSKDVAEKKEQHDDYEKTTYSAYVGGVTSFDVANMKLKLTKDVALKSWSPEKKNFYTKKWISSEVIKAKNDNGKVYSGYAAYYPVEEDAVFVIAKLNSKEKNTDDKFYVLLFDDKLELTEKPFDLKGSYSLVFCEQVANKDIVIVFAPNKDATDISKYVYFQYDIKGNLKNKAEFNSPATAMLITAAYEKEGSVYFCGSSQKSTDPYEKVFREYAPIYNPGITPGGMNMKDIYWQKAAAEKMDNFHLLKFSGNILTFVSTTPVADFKTKFKTSPSDKDASLYKGSKFSITNFFVTPSGDYLIAGQLTSTINMGTANPSVKSFEDIVCLHFDKNGNLKAQYGIGKMNNDKKSEIFEMPQNFYLSKDGKKLLWEILEVKGTKGYESFLDAYNGNASFYPLYFPRIGSIDLENSTLSTFKILGNEKFFLRKDFISIFDKDEESITYFGHDDDFKNLWVGKVTVQ